MQNEDTRFSAAVKREREKRGWNQTELAQELAAVGLTHFHQNTVSRIEKNDRVVRLSEAAVIASLFGKTIQEMTSAYIPEVDRLTKATVAVSMLESRLIGLTDEYIDALSELGAEIAKFEAWLMRLKDEGTAADIEFANGIMEWAVSAHNLLASEVARQREEVRQGQDDARQWFEEQMSEPRNQRSDDQ